jgi:hypothetical protein
MAVRKPTALRQTAPARLAGMTTMVMVRRVRGAATFHVGAASALGLAPA